MAKQKTVLTDADKFYLEANSSLDLATLADAVGCSQQTVTDFLAAIPPKPNTSSIISNVTATGKSRGVAILTKGGSERADDDRQMNKSKKFNPERIHKMRPNESVY